MAPSVIGRLLSFRVTTVTHSVRRPTDNELPLAACGPPGHRGQGLAGQLLAALLPRVGSTRSIHLDVETGNEPARRVYAAAGDTLTPEAGAAMDAWIQQNRQEKHGAHRYAPEDFALDVGELRRRFRFYQDAHGIPDDPRFAA